MPYYCSGDGDVVQYDVTNQVVSETMLFEIPTDNYYVAIFHRNHLPLMTDLPIALSSSTTTVDFTSFSQTVYGTDPRLEIVAGVYCMYAGDGNFDNVVDATDRSLTWNFPKPKWLFKNGRYPKWHS